MGERPRTGRTKYNAGLALSTRIHRTAMCAIACVGMLAYAPSGECARMLLERSSGGAAIHWSPLTPVRANAAFGSSLVSAAAGESSQISSTWPWEVRWSSSQQTQPPPPVALAPNPPPPFMSSPSPPPAPTPTISTRTSPPSTQNNWWLSWSSVERDFVARRPPPPSPPPPPPPPPSVAAAIKRMESLDEAMQMAELLATLLIQEDLSSERLTAYTEIAAQAFVNHHESDALEFAQSELQSWLFDEVLAFASDENFLNSARTTFASSTRSGESGDVFGEDILYAAEALAAYQMSERRYDDGSTTDPIVTSASFSELTPQPSSSIDDDVRASIARDRLSRLVSPALLGDPQLLASALQPSLFASLLSDPSVLAYLTTAFGASDSITSSLAG